MDYCFTIQKYILYLLKGKTKYYIHSPFVFQFVNEVLSDKRTFYCYNEIEQLRMILKQSNDEVGMIDWGAGSYKLKNKKVKVKEIVSASVKPKKYSQLLFRIANYYNCENILELGTSLGLTTLYLSAAHERCKVVTLEGNPLIAQLAKKNFQKHSRKNIELIEGNFNDTLTNTLNRFDNLDLVFFDGNHREKPTIEYFEKCLTKIHNNSIFVFDDIYWSKEMNKAWKQIKTHSSVTLTIDLFQLGIVFFRKENRKENVTLYF